MEEQSVDFHCKCLRGPITGHVSTNCGSAWISNVSLDLACHHQAVCKHRPCAITHWRGIGRHNRWGIVIGSQQQLSQRAAKQHTYKKTLSSDLTSNCGYLIRKYKEFRDNESTEFALWALIFAAELFLSLWCHCWVYPCWLGLAALQTLLACQYLDFIQNRYLGILLWKPHVFSSLRCGCWVVMTRIFAHVSFVLLFLIPGFLCSFVQSWMLHSISDSAEIRACVVFCWAALHIKSSFLLHWRTFALCCGTVIITAVYLRWMGIFPAQECFQLLWPKMERAE